MANYRDAYPPCPGEGYVLICRASKTLPNGTKVYARNEGKKAYCFWVPADKAY